MSYVEGLTKLRALEAQALRRAELYKSEIVKVKPSGREFLCSLVDIYFQQLFRVKFLEFHAKQSFVKPAGLVEIRKEMGQILLSMDTLQKELEKLAPEVELAVA